MAFAKIDQEKSMGRGTSAARKKAEAYVMKRPDAKPADVAKKFGINLSTAYRVRAAVLEQQTEKAAAP